VIRIRGFAISDERAAGLAERLRVQSDASLDVAERLERALLLGTGMLGTDRPQAEALIAVLDEDPAFMELRGFLGIFIESSGS
jgi:hypothetical protein